MTNPRGEYIRTYTGKKFYPLDPRSEDVCIEDIARHLAMQCRFNGGLNSFYSVAQHSCIVSDLAFKQTKDPDVALWGLLHDAAEAYIGDRVRPLKRTAELSDFRKIEARVMAAIVEKFDLQPAGEPALIGELDARICITEALQLRDNSKGDVVNVREGYEPIDYYIEPWRWELAEIELLTRFRGFR